jgi:hypothetical protein
MGIVLPAHREKESMLPDLRNSPYQSTQPTSNTAIVAPSINKTVSLPAAQSGYKRHRRYRPANKKDEARVALIRVSGVNELNEGVPLTSKSSDQEITCWTESRDVFDRLEKACQKWWRVTAI